METDEDVPLKKCIIDYKLLGVSFFGVEMENVFFELFRDNACQNRKQLLSISVR